MRIVEYRDPARLAVVVVVPDAERVADFVGRELADAGERPLEDVLRHLGAGLVGAEQPLGDHVVLADTKGSQRHDAFDDLAGPWIGHAGAGAPAASGAMHP